MLVHLSVHNYAIVEHLDLELQRGMSVITGETGAGKSIMLDALGLALGDRGPKRPMSEATVTAALANMGFKGEIVAHGFRHMAKTALMGMRQANGLHRWNENAIERQLSHKKEGIKGVYDLQEHMPERTEMLQAWADYLDALRTGANVVPIRRKSR